MKILDIIENVITETDESILDQLVDLFKKTTGEFKSASHKFYYVRKVLSNKLEGEDQETVKKVIPSEFFNYMKSKKPVNKPEPTPPKPETVSDEKTELVEPTQDDLDKAGTSHALISRWAEKYYKHYEPEEIADVLYNSVVGNYEDKVFINREVRSAIINIKRRKEDQQWKEMYPEMQKKFKPSKEELESLKGTDIYDEAMRDVKKGIDNQPRVVGQKPQKPQHVVMYYKKQIEDQNKYRAFQAYKNGDENEAKNFLTKYEILKNATGREILQWYWAHR